MSSRLRTLRDHGLGLLADALLGIGALLPYRARVRGLGWVAARLIAPPAGLTRITRENLSATCPELPASDVRRLTRAVADNAARTLVEILSDRELARFGRAARIIGDEGLAALEKAHAEGRGVLLMSGHLGNFMVPGIALRARGFRTGAIYRPMNNHRFDARWSAALGRSLDAIFARDRRGMARMIGFLRDGGMVGVLNDQHSVTGAPLSFFGRTAHTALSAAELALKYDALMVPVYGIRRADGFSFDVVVEPPIPHSTPERMIQQYNDSLERQVRQYMDQWLWLHRRWKPRRARGSSTAPAVARRTGSDTSP